MTSSPPPPAGSDPSGRPSYAEENALRIAAESLTRYDAQSDTYHCSYGPPIPAATLPDLERGILVRVEPQTRQVVGFSIPNFKQWYAEHAEADGSFGLDLPSVWPAGDGASDDD